MRLHYLVYISLFLFCVGTATSSSGIHINKIIGNLILGSIDSKKPCRLSICQQSDKDITYTSALSDLNIDKVISDPYISIAAVCEDLTTPLFLNYLIPKENYKCNAKKLRIKEVKQLQDSCVQVTLKYSGSGDLYILNRLSHTNIPNADNIIREGIYLGNHNKEDISTIICKIYEKSSYTLYATAVDGVCTHIPVSFDFTAEDFSDDMKWSKNSNRIWTSQHSNNINYGVHYRRFGGISYPDSIINDLDMTPQGILINSMQDVNSIFEKQLGEDASMSDDSSMNLLNNNLIWKKTCYNQRILTGLFMLFGKGNVYIYCSPKKSVDIQTVIDKGKNVGYFEDDAVDVMIDGHFDDSYSIYAVVEYINQYFGPYVKRVQQCSD